MASEKRLIDANALMDDFRRYMVKRYDKEKCVSEENCKVCEKSCLWRKIVSDAPTIDAVEVVHGHWTSTGIFSKRAGYGVRYYQHAECEVAPCRLFECEHDYCPNCGAKMDGGNENV